MSLGSNIGHRGRNLARLRDALTDGGVSIIAASPEILTRPVGVTAQGDFHNQVRPPAQPGAVDAASAGSSTAAARSAPPAGEPRIDWGPRIADADILLLGERR